MTKEEPKVLLIDEGEGLCVAVWLQRGMVSQGTSIENALSSLLVAIRARAQLDKEDGREPFWDTEEADTEFWRMYKQAEEWEPNDVPLREALDRFEREFAIEITRPHFRRRRIEQQLSTG
jgi:hypothetical protein